MLSELNKQKLYSILESDKPDFNHETKKQMAHEMGQEAKKAGSGPNCPFGPEVHHDYYHAWHKGYKGKKLYESNDPYAETLAHISKKLKKANTGWHSIFHREKGPMVIRRHDSEEQANKHVDNKMVNGGGHDYVGAGVAYHHGGGKWSWDGKLNESQNGNPNPLSDKGETLGQKQMIDYANQHMDVADDEEMGLDHNGVSQSQNSITNGDSDLEKFNHHTKMAIYHKKLASQGDENEHSHKVAAYLHHIASDHYNQARDAMANGDETLASIHRNHGSINAEKAKEYATLKEDVLEEGGMHTMEFHGTMEKDGKKYNFKDKHFMAVIGDTNLAQKAIQQDIKNKYHSRGYKNATIHKVVKV